MSEVITFGETMAVMTPNEKGRLSEVSGFHLTIAGAESNTAIGLARLGHSVSWISALGDDEMGRFILKKISDEGVDTSLIKIDPSNPTGLMLKEFKDGKTNVYYYRKNSAAANYTSEELPLDCIKKARILHLTGITPVLSDSCRRLTEELIGFAKQNGILVSFDPNLRPKLWGGQDRSGDIARLMLSSDIALVGISEAKVLLGTSDVEEIIRTLTEAGVKYVALKDGERGAYCSSGESTVFIPPFPCNSVDAVGAGDGFGAGFLAGILEGRNIEEAGKMGGIVGAMATESSADVEGYPTKKEMEARLK